MRVRGIFHFGFDKALHDVDRRQLIGADSVSKDFDTAARRIEFPFAILLNQRDRKRRIVITDGKGHTIRTI